MSSLKLSKEEIKCFNKGWGRALANSIHWLRCHSSTGLSLEEKDQLVEYMEETRKKQYTSTDSDKGGL